MPWFPTIDKTKKGDSKNLPARAKKKNSLGHLADMGYVLKEVLGEGSYCKVRAARYKGQALAVKVIARNHLSNDFKAKFLPRELEILGRIKHENIIKVHKIFDYRDHVYIFMEYLKRGDLLSEIRLYGRMMEDVAGDFFSQIVKAIEYLHGLNIAHRDIKCENIMITDDNVIKLIDFGFSRCTVNSSGKRLLSRTYCGSMAYASPEVLQGRPYNPMLYDMWSLGCVLFIMVTSAMPFDDSNVARMVNTQLKKLFRYPTTFKISSSLKKLISKMLEPDVTKRMSIRRVADHRWVQKWAKRHPDSHDESPCASELTGSDTSGSTSTGTQTEKLHLHCQSCEKRVASF